LPRADGPRLSWRLSWRQTARMDAVIESADATGIDYEVVACDPELADTAAFCERYDFSPADSANTIVVASKGESPVMAACVVLATHRLDVNGVVRRRLAARKVSFAPADLTAEVTGMVMGGVTPFGLPEGLPVWVDAAVMERDEIIVGGGSRSMKLVLPPATLAALAETCGPERRAVVARELTKLHEELRRGTLAELAAWATAGVKGEVVVVVDGADASVDLDDGELVERLRTVLAEGSSKRDAVDRVVAATGARRGRVYDLSLTI